MQRVWLAIVVDDHVELGNDSSAVRSVVTVGIATAATVDDESLPMRRPTCDRSHRQFVCLEHPDLSTVRGHHGEVPHRPCSQLIRRPTAGPSIAASSVIPSATNAMQPVISVIAIRRHRPQLSDLNTPPPSSRSANLVERPHAADAVPRVLRERRLALAFVALQEAGDEELLGQRRQLHAARLAVAARPAS